MEPEATARARELLSDPFVESVARRIRDTSDETLRHQIELTEIPAPPYGEGARAERFVELLAEAGVEAKLDEEGNVSARIGPSGPAIVLSAHLDTVFPAGTDVGVRRRGDRLVGPGIGDNGRGLAALLTLARTVTEVDAAAAPPLLLLASVGEEGSGDLRGVRHFFREGGPGRAARGFVSLDGAGIQRLVTRGLGSSRYRVRSRGPGGHSWVDFGAPNPIHALGRLVAGVGDLALPADPATTLTVARWSGGTSINAIPEEAWIELEIRSESPGEIERLDRAVRRLVEETATVENAGAPPEPLEVEVESIGERPAAGTPEDDPLVRSAVAATRALGGSPEHAVSSTDANVPMSLGIPALTIGAGGEAGKAHTLEEWYRDTAGPEGIVRALLTVVLFDELTGG